MTDKGFMFGQVTSVCENNLESNTLKEKKILVYEKMYLKTYMNKEYICLKNNTGQLYFILGRAGLCWKVCKY